MYGVIEMQNSLLVVVLLNEFMSAREGLNRIVDSVVMKYPKSGLCEH
jgi:hypothetical protein